MKIQKKLTVLPSITCSCFKTSSRTDGSLYVTNPNPRGLPVFLSFMIIESIISPYFSKCLLNTSETER